MHDLLFLSFQLQFKGVHSEVTFLDHFVIVAVAQARSHVQLFETPWIAPC